MARPSNSTMTCVPSMRKSTRHVWPPSRISTCGVTLKPSCHRLSQPGLPWRLRPSVDLVQDSPDGRDPVLVPEVRQLFRQLIAREQSPVQSGVGGNEGLHRPVELAGLDYRGRDSNQSTGGGMDDRPGPVSRLLIRHPGEVHHGQVCEHGREVVQQEQGVMAGTSAALEVAHQRSGRHPVPVSEVLERPRRVPAPSEAVTLTCSHRAAQL